MAKIKVRPWRDRTELLAVRAKLFLANEAQNIIARRDACEQVEVWRRRTRLPHAIESTALLVQAQIHTLSSEGTEIDSMFVIRAALATALARFITGFCDINQPTVVKRSMFDVAAELNMPEQWVELRHQFTHGGELPSHSALATAVAGALTWLWQTYWSRFEHDIQSTKSSDKDIGDVGMSEIDGHVEDEVAIRKVLKTFMSARKDELKKALANLDAAQAAVSALTKIQLHSPNSTVDILQLNLVVRCMIIPAGGLLSNNSLVAFKLWDPLLLKLSLNFNGFLPKFITGVVAQLTNDDETMDEIQDHSHEAFVAWLDHIFNSSDWLGRRAISQDDFRELRGQVMEECVLYPGHWTHVLLTRLSATIPNESSGEWIGLQSASILKSTARDGDSTPHDAEMEDSEMEIQETGLQLPAFAPKEYGSWKHWPGRWKPVPIGVAGGEA